MSVLSGIKNLTDSSMVSVDLEQSENPPAPTSSTMFCKLFVIAALVACAAATLKPGYAVGLAATSSVATPIAAPGLGYGGLGYSAGLGYDALERRKGPGGHHRQDQS